tara:strand:- start:117 stop:1154 length:1038 start_codon:yes stop_codon:yes gene_type:complete
VYEKQKARREKDGKRRLKERQAAAKAEAETKARTRQLQTAKREKKEREEREAREAKEAQGTARAKLKARLQERMIKETPRTLGRDDVLLEALCCMIVVDGPVSEKEQEKLFKIAGRLESSYSSDQIAKLVSSAATRSRMKGGVAKQLESFFGNLQVVALSTEDKKALLADLLVLSEVDGGPGKHQTQLLNRLMDAFFPEAPNDTLENKPNANELAAERVHSLESNSNATPHVFTTLLKSFCCMMAADGKVVADEKKAAKTILNRLNCPLTHDEIAHVVQEFRDQVASQGIELVLQHTLSEIRHFLRNKSSKKSFRKLLGEIASADGDVTEDEKQVARRMLQAMSG